MAEPFWAHELVLLPIWQKFDLQVRLLHIIVTRIFINVNQNSTKHLEGLALDVEATTHCYPVYFQMNRRRGERTKAREFRLGGQIKKPESDH